MAQFNFCCLALLSLFEKDKMVHLFTMIAMIHSYKNNKNKYTSSVIQCISREVVMIISVIISKYVIYK